MPIAPIASAYLKLVLVHAFLRHGLLPQSLAALLILGVKSLKPTKVARFIFALPRKLVPARGRPRIPRPFAFARQTIFALAMTNARYRASLSRNASSLSRRSLIKARQEHQRKKNRDQKKLQRQGVLGRRLHGEGTQTTRGTQEGKVGGNKERETKDAYFKSHSRPQQKRKRRVE